MSFWQKLTKSVYDPAFYREVSGQSFSTAFVFFIKYVLLLSAITSVVSLTLLGSFVYRGEMDETVKAVKSLYPEELIITIEKDGTISINREQPYGIPIPWEGMKDVNGEDVEYLVVFDTEYPITSEAFDEYRTIVIVGDKSIGVKEESGKVQIQTIDPSGEEGDVIVLDRAKVESGVDMAVAFIRETGFVWICVLLPISIFVGMLLGMMVYLVFASLIIWLIATVKGLHYGYGQSYVIGMHLVALPQAVSMLAGWAIVVRIPLLRTIILVVLAVVNLKSANQQPTTNDPQQSPNNSRPTIDYRDSKSVSEPKDVEIQVK